MMVIMENNWATLRIHNAEKMAALADRRDHGIEEAVQNRGI